MKRTVTMMVCDVCDAAQEKTPKTPGLLIREAKLVNEDGEPATYRDVFLCSACCGRRSLTATLLAIGKKGKGSAKVCWRTRALTEVLRGAAADGGACHSFPNFSPGGAETRAETHACTLWKV